MDGKIILEIWKSFFDNNLQEHKSTDYIELKLTSMKEVFYEAYNLPRKFLPDVYDCLWFNAIRNCESTSRNFSVS